MSVKLVYIKRIKVHGPPALSEYKCRLNGFSNSVNYEILTGLVDLGKAVDVIYLDFRKAFDTFSHNILVENLVAHSLDGSTPYWVKNWLYG